MQKLGLAIALLIVGGLASAWLQWDNLTLGDLTAADIGARFLGVIFVALFIERAVEIYVNAEYSEEENRILRPVKTARLAVQNSVKTLDEEVKRIVPVVHEAMMAAADAQAKTERMDDAQSKVVKDRAAQQDAIEAASIALMDLTAEKKRSAAVASLVLSLGAAMVGFRVLGQLLASMDGTGATPPAAPAMQMNWFRAYDVLITALVLSGGADGLHKIIGKFLSDRESLMNPK